MTFTCIRKSQHTHTLTRSYTHVKLILRISRACICLSLEALSEQLRLMITPLCNNISLPGWAACNYDYLHCTLHISHQTKTLSAELNSLNARLHFLLLVPSAVLKYLVISQAKTGICSGSSLKYHLCMSYTNFNWIHVDLATLASTTLMELSK